MYDQTHVYWTFHWTAPDGTGEQGQVGLRTTTPGTPPTLSTVESVGDAFAVLWNDATGGMSTQYKFFRTKAALVLPSGLYDPDFDPVIDDRTPDNGGGGAVYYPLQVACVASLETDRSSGPAHAGRIYLPPVAGDVSSLGKFPATEIAARAVAVATFITSLNTITGETAMVMSTLGSGASRPITGVRVGDRPDVQRRRAAQQSETYTALAGV